MGTYSKFLVALESLGSVCIGAQLFMIVHFYTFAGVYTFSEITPFILVPCVVWTWHLKLKSFPLATLSGWSRMVRF